MKKDVWIGSVVHLEEDIAPDALDWLKQKKFLKVMNLQARRSLQAAYLALRKADGQGESGRTGEFSGISLSLENLVSGHDDWEAAKILARQKTGKEAPGIQEIGSSLPPLALLPRLPNTIAGHLAREFDVTGPCLTSGQEASAGLEAVVQASRWVADGECERVIVARVESEGSMAALVQSKPGKGFRQILAWSAKNFDSAGTDDFLDLRSTLDWGGWDEARILRSGREESIQLVLGNA